MRRKRTISISYDNWFELSEIKLQENFESMDETMEVILDRARCYKINKLKGLIKNNGCKRSN